MNFSKLAKYFCGMIPNSQKTNISDFINILQNIGIEWKITKEFGNKFWAIKKDYENLFNIILNSENWENKISNILEYFELPKSFIETIDYSDNDIIDIDKNNLVEIKTNLLNKFNEVLKKLKDSKNNKNNWNEFEKLCEDFLLQSSYFKPWFKEFSFEDWTEKIDRLLRLKKDILNFWKNINFLWYVIVESKYKNKDKNWAGEVNQLESYINRLHKYWISRYAIIITSTDYKKEYRTKLLNFCKDLVKDNIPFYCALITVYEIKNFLENEWIYKNMSFDEFIERSFIKWLS